MSEDLELSFDAETMEMSWFSMPGWKEPDYLRPVAGAAGHLEPGELASKIVEGKVSFQVYRPAGYGEGTRRYPVVYVHGGAEALKHGGWKDSLDHLIGNTVAPVVVVFIESIPARGPQYSQVLVEELVPYIDEHYRTLPEGAGRANVGGNFSGVSALLATFAHPDTFGGVGTQSAALFDFAWVPLQEQVRPASETPLRVYLDWGKYDLRNSRENWNLAESNKAMWELLVERGYVPSGGEAADGAGWPSWRNRTAELLTALFPLD
jgi:enterochelin esterase-like enzyme